MSTAQRKCKTNALGQLFSNATAVFRRFRPAENAPAAAQKPGNDGVTPRRTASQAKLCLIRQRQICRRLRLISRALSTARSNKLRSWELRAAASLARFWRDQGRATAG